MHWLHPSRTGHGDSTVSTDGNGMVGQPDGSGRCSRACVQRAVVDNKQQQRRACLLELLLLWACMHDWVVCSATPHAALQLKRCTVGPPGCGATWPRPVTDCCGLACQFGRFGRRHCVTSNSKLGPGDFVADDYGSVAPNTINTCLRHPSHNNRARVFAPAVRNKCWLGDITWRHLVNKHTATPA